MVAVPAAAPLRFFTPAELRVTVDLPAAEAGRIRAVDAEILRRRLRSAANDRAGGVFLVGWAPGALLLVAADPWLRAKRLVWILPAGAVTAFLNEEARLPVRLDLQLGWCRWSGEAAYLLAMHPVLGSLVVLDPEWCAAHELNRWISHRLRRRALAFERTLRDLHHLAARLDGLPRAIPLTALRGACCGRSALCLAAGPSLDRRLDFIRAHQDRCVVIACDVIQQRAEAVGVRIDFLLTVDSAQDIVERIGIPRNPECVLVMPLLGHRELDQRFRLVAHFGEGAMARELLGDGATFMTGTTVGIATVGFAAFLGCTEVVLAGHDLAQSKEAYYSRLVGNQETADATEQALQAQHAIEVEGNDGGKVVSNQAFETAIQDLGVILHRHPQMPAWNLNLLDGLGARIPFARNLPEAWAPHPDRLPILAPEITQVRLPIPALDAAGLRHRLEYELRDLVTCWREALVGTNDILTAYARVSTAAGNEAEGLLAHFVRAPVLNQILLDTLPATLSTIAHRSGVLRHLSFCLDQALGILPALLQRDEPLPEPVWDETVTRYAGREFHLTASIAEPGIITVAEAIMCQSYREMAKAGTALALPSPRTPEEGLHLCSRLGAAVPRGFLLETLALCHLEDATRFADPLAWAVACGVVCAEDLAATDPDACRDPHPALAAAAAIRALGQGRSGDLLAAARRALAWPCAQPFVARALAGRTGGMAVLQRLADERALLLDDQVCALIVLHAPEVRQATALIAPVMAGLGDATVLALAQRLHAAGRHVEALRHLDAFRSLSRFHDQAVILACECRLALGDGPGLLDACRRIEDPPLRSHWLARYEQRFAGQDGTLERLETETRPLQPAMIAGLVATAWKARDHATLDRLLALMARGWLPGQEDEGRRLHASAQQLRSRLPSVKGPAR